MPLLDHPDAKAFLLHWGEMGTQWGVNRSVSQVHALLYLSDRPLPADEIVDQLGLARSNVSTALKELQSYAIVRRVHVESDRRDHFVAELDLWEMLTRIAAERKRREIDPTIALLNDLAQRLAKDGSARPMYANASPACTNSCPLWATGMSRCACCPSPHWSR